MQSLSAKKADAGLEEQGRVEKELPLGVGTDDKDSIRHYLPSQASNSELIVALKQIANVSIHRGARISLGDQPAYQGIITNIMQLMHNIRDQHTAYIVDNV